MDVREEKQFLALSFPLFVSFFGTVKVLAYDTSPSAGRAWMEEWHYMNERLALCGAQLLRTLVLKLLKGNSSDKCTSITIKYSAGVLSSTGEIVQVPKNLEDCRGTGRQ